MGRWSDANCNKALSSENCLPGEIIWKDCNQCICQENRQFLCTNSTCTDKLSPIAFKTSQVDTGSHECTPFRSYYVDCYLCTCPASGLTKEARCVPDKSCMALGPKSLDLKVLLSVCIPNVMYVFNCINCMCSENGYFILSKCINTCIKTRPNNNTCVPGTLYKSECNVCKCYNNSVPNNKLCTNVDCNFVKKRSLPVLQNETGLCVPNRFTRPKCFYCECGDKGAINKNACYELNCLNDPEIRYDLEHRTCSPGEIVPFCMVCFCLYNGIIDKRLCSKSCSFKNKVYVLEKMLKESFKYPGAFNRKRNDDSTCEPHTVFIDHGKYCICPDDGNINSKYCILSKYNKFLDFQAEMKIGSNISCTPNTFVDFDCNTCYCNKSGKIDVSWCTYDDCESKRQVQQKNRANEIAFDTNKCTPGSISKKDCNFCICPESLLLRERACTNNTCHTDKSNNNKELDDKLYCDPLEYYTVDCNLCYCPHDGLKNIDKCTKKVCEKNFLRSNLCEPGDLFANDCKICVCPPNGDKKDSVCTNHTCSNADIPWNKVFKLTQDLLGLNNLEVTTRSIDPCFPGEEFTVGCKICVCPEMGLRKFATCTPFSCDINNVSIVYNKKSMWAIHLELGVSRETVENGIFIFFLSLNCSLPYVGL